MSGQWLARQTGDGTVHVLPLDDHLVHDHHTDCPCGPTPEPAGRGLVITHHSLDGRELTEPDRNG